MSKEKFFGRIVGIIVMVIILYFLPTIADFFGIINPFKSLPTLDTIFWLSGIIGSVQIGGMIAGNED